MVSLKAHTLSDVGLFCAEAVELCKLKHPIPIVRNRVRRIRSLIGKYRLYLGISYIKVRIDMSTYPNFNVGDDPHQNIYLEEGGSSLEYDALSTSGHTSSFLSLPSQSNSDRSCCIASISSGVNEPSGK